MKIKVLKAKHGDCILLKWYDKKGNDRYFIIDSGVSSTYIKLKRELGDINQLDCFLLTHIDDDHIAGFLKLLTHYDEFETKILNYFINTPDLIEISESNPKKSITQANSVIDLLKEKKQYKQCKSLYFENYKKVINKSNFDDLNVKILSPNLCDLERLHIEFNKEMEQSEIKVKKSAGISTNPLDLEILALEKDVIRTNIFNDCSIVILLHDKENSILLLADSNPRIVLKNLLELDYNQSNKLYIDYVKLSHHGSKHNISKELIDIIECNNFIISTNGGLGNSKHPDRETIAKIVCKPGRDQSKKMTFWFNYRKEEIERLNGIIATNEEEEKYNFECKYINEEFLI